LNAIRVQKGIKDADVIIVRFGDDYKQWNTAFDAGYAAAMGKCIIVIHSVENQHALKEIDAIANAVAESPVQAVQLLRYIVDGVIK
jgi:YtoQ family protein